jgi:hypothetical protein
MVRWTRYHAVVALISCQGQFVDNGNNNNGVSDYPWDVLSQPDIYVLLIAYGPSSWPRPPSGMF